MASPSLTYTLTNGTTADASQVMQNFNDLLNGITDGTKDLSISALTCAGTATLNGHINLGNSSADDLTITASLASTLPIKTTNTYDIGTTTIGLRALYFGANSQTVNLKGSGSMSATWTMTLPVSAGSNLQSLRTNGSGVTSWAYNSTLSLNSVSSAGYTVLDTDGYDVIAVSTGSTNRTVTLPASATNAGRRITFKKTDSGTGNLIISRAGSDTIDFSFTSVNLGLQYDSITLVCNGTNWDYVGEHYQSKITATTLTWNGTGSPGTSSSRDVVVIRRGKLCTASLTAVTATTGTTSTTFSSNTGFDTWAQPSTVQAFACTQIVDNAVAIAASGLIRVATDGTFSIRRDATSTAFTNGSTCGTGAAVTFAWYLN